MFEDLRKVSSKTHMTAYACETPPGYLSERWRRTRVQKKTATRLRLSRHHRILQFTVSFNIHSTSPSPKSKTNSRWGPSITVDCSVDVDLQNQVFRVFVDTNTLASFRRSTSWIRSFHCSSPSEHHLVRPSQWRGIKGSLGASFGRFAIFVWPERQTKGKHRPWASYVSTNQFKTYRIYRAECGQIQRFM